MATSVRLELNRDGIRQVALLSPEVRGRLRQIAEATATRARGMTNLEIDVRDGNGRSRAAVHVGMLGPAAAATEAKHRILGRSLTNGG